MQVEHWLDDFAARVRARDLDGARSLFDPACVSFGTRTAYAGSLDALMEHQWTPVWAGTSGFHFTDVQVVAGGSDVAAVASRWSSIADIDTRVRIGRATIVLCADDEAAHGCRCVHTHFSTAPEPELL